MTLFETETKSQRNSTKKRVTALKFCMEVALKRYNEKLFRNGGGTAAIAEFFWRETAVTAVSPSSQFHFVPLKATVIPNFSALNLFLS